MQGHLRKQAGSHLQIKTVCMSQIEIRGPDRHGAVDIDGQGRYCAPIDELVKDVGKLLGAPLRQRQG